MITGKGVPDLATRKLIKLLQVNFNLPSCGLFDFNPGGIDVFLTYRLGSSRMALESWRYSSDIHFLGLTASDVLDSSKFLPLSPASSARIASLLHHPFVLKSPNLLRHLHDMQLFGTAELEALTPSQLTACVIRKLFRHEYLI